MKNKLLNFQEILVYFLPLALLTGNFFPDLIVVILGLIFLIVVDYKKEKKYFYNYFCYFFIFFWVFLIISSIQSELPTYSITSSLPYIRFLFFSLSVWYLIDRKENFVKNFTLILMYTFIVVIIDGYIQYFSGSSIFGYHYQGGRLTALISGEKIIGTYLSRLYPLLIATAMLTYTKSKKISFLLLIIFVLIDVLIFLSGERVAFFNLMLSAILFIFLINKWKKLRILSFLTSIILVLFITMIDIKVTNRMIFKTLDQTNISRELGNKRFLFSEEHQNFYTTSLKMFYNNPLLGIGPKMYRHICKDDQFFNWTKNYPIVHSCSTHPHGTFFQLIAEIGIIGIIPYILAFISIIYLFFRNFLNTIFKKKTLLSDYELCLLIAITISLWPLIPTMQFFHNWISIIYYLPVGFLLSYQYKKSLITIQK